MQRHRLAENSHPVGPSSLLGILGDDDGIRIDIDLYSSEADPTRTLTFVNGAAMLTDTTQDIVDAFDASGRLVERQDREGDTLFTVSYVGTSDAIAAITDPLGGSASFSYTGGLLQSVTDAANRTTTFDYNGTSDLTSFTEPDGETWSFEYTDHRMTQKTSPEGDVTKYQYGPDNTVQTITKPAGETYSIAAGYSQPPGADANGNPTYAASYMDTHGVTHS